MVLGLGIDLVEIARIERSLKQFGDTFLQRILRPDEITYCQAHRAPAPHVAGRFAVKEAVSKAFGTGIGAELGWLDIEVGRGQGGEPKVILHGKGADLAQSRNIDVVHVSITHTATHAAAVAVLERLEKSGDATSFI